MNLGLISRSCALALAVAQALTLAASPAEKAAPLSTFCKLPIKEITVFKDGHAFVAHEGEMPTDEHGNVVMDYLPAPVIGTFWPYSAEKLAKLTSVIASQKRVLVERTGSDPSDNGGLFVGRRPGTAPVRFRSLPKRGSERRRRLD